MKIFFPLFQRSIEDLSKDISWAEHNKKGYVIRDPMSPDDLLYLSEGEYKKLVRIAISNETTLDVIVTPKDTPVTVQNRFPSLSKDNSEKSPFSFGERGFPRDFIINLIPGWKLKESMIEIERNFGPFLPIYYKNIISWLGHKSSRVNYQLMLRLGNFFNVIFKTRGINQVILIMKISSIVILQYIGGNPMENTEELGQRVKLIHGLPAHLPSNFRRLIRSGNVLYQRIFITLYHSYKGLKGVYGSPDLSSIQAPTFNMKEWIDNKSKGRHPLNTTPFKKYDFSGFFVMPKHVMPFWDFINPKKIICDFRLDLNKLPLIMTASPLTSKSYMSAGTAALAHLEQDTKLIKFLRLLCSATASPETPKIGNPWTEGAYQCLSYMKNMAFLQTLMYKEHTSETRTPSEIGKSLPLGKLSIKEEAAGKIRVFAISDYWTQYVMKPIHNSMFRVLKEIPSDATFNQLERVKEFSSRRHSFIASYDLKSATDMIPQSIYTLVLRPWMNHVIPPIPTLVPTILKSYPPQWDLCRLWLDVMVDRDYYFKGEPFRYTRGQPMGTLSSWSSLALIHHFLVFVAAREAGKAPFTDYLVLGDDIVIGDEDVAQAYSELCDSQGIKIGYAKSFVSNNEFFQFASQNLIGETNISPISLKEVLSIQLRDRYTSLHSGITSIAAKCEFVSRLNWKGFLKTGKLFNLVRAVVSARDWKLYSRALSRGIFPRRMGNLLLNMLSSPFLVRENTFGVSILMAVLRQDIKYLTKEKSYPLLDQIHFMEDLAIYFLNKFEDKATKAHDDLIKGEARDRDWIINPATMDIVDRMLYDVFIDQRQQIEDCHETFTELSIRFESLIYENQIRHLWLEEEEENLSRISMSEIHLITKCLSDLDSIKLAIKSADEVTKTNHSERLTPLVRGLLDLRLTVAKATVSEGPNKPISQVLL